LSELAALKGLTAGKQALVEILAKGEEERKTKGVEEQSTRRSKY
jgi:hypothetical protein